MDRKWLDLLPFVKLQNIARNAVLADVFVEIKVFKSSIDKWSDGQRNRVFFGNCKFFFCL